MFAESRYIVWTRRLYGNVKYDLASSGIPLVTGLSSADVDDMGAYPRLVDAIGAYNECPASEVVPAIGATQAVFLAYAAMLSAGDEILVESPGYEPLTRAAEGLGATVRTFERREENGFAIDPSEVAARVTPRTRAIVVTTLHNPTGVRVPDETLRELARIAEARGAYLIVDEVYAAFDELAEAGIFRGSARKLAANVVCASSLTKCYGLGMHRIGWVLGPPEIVAAATSAAIATFGHLPLSHAAIALEAFGRLGELTRRARSLYLGKREIAAEWVASLGAKARWSAPKEGLFGLVTLPGRGNLLPDIEVLAEKTGVLVGAGAFFGAPSSFRLSWATCDEPQFRKGLELLEPLVASSR